MNTKSCLTTCVWLCALCLLAVGRATAADAPAEAKRGELISENLDAFKPEQAGWRVCGDAKLDPENRKRLAGSPGKGVLLGNGKAANLSTKASFRDCQIELEFMIPEKSNSGIKLNGFYEIQILDSAKKQKLTGSDCGGIYPRAGMRDGKYTTFDEGVPPKVNAAREPGEWQTLKLTFHSPRFDADGKKTSNARFDRVELNGKLIHEHQEVAYPTGHRWELKETPTGPVLLQGDHGPVAFRNVRVQSLEE